VIGWGRQVALAFGLREETAIGHACAAVSKLRGEEDGRVEGLARCIEEEFGSGGLSATSSRTRFLNSFGAGFGTTKVMPCYRACP
jgi:hypothetical protein